MTISIWKQPKDSQHYAPNSYSQQSILRMPSLFMLSVLCWLCRDTANNTTQHIVSFSLKTQHNGTQHNDQLSIIAVSMRRWNDTEKLIIRIMRYKIKKLTLTTFSIMDQIVTFTKARVVCQVSICFEYLCWVFLCCVSLRWVSWCHLP
jgi:hypothetical protein